MKTSGKIDNFMILADAIAKIMIFYEFYEFFEWKLCFFSMKSRDEACCFVEMFSVVFVLTGSFTRNMILLEIFSDENEFVAALKKF